MAFYRSVRKLEPMNVAGSNAILRAPVSSDYATWKKVRLDSQEFLVPWEPKWPENDLTRLGFRRRLKRYERELENKTGATYFLVKNEKPIGGVSISNIRHGVARSCSIGYWMGINYAGQGHMGRVLPVIGNYVFNVLGLCRIEAACLPANERSARLLTGAGYKREGLLRKYLEINGRREDHALYSLLNDDA